MSIKAKKHRVLAARTWHRGVATEPTRTAQLYVSDCGVVFSIYTPNACDRARLDGTLGKVPTVDKSSPASHTSVHRRWRRSCALWTTLLWALADGAAGADGVTIQLALDGMPLEGTPIAWNSSLVVMLTRNGHLHQFHPDKAEGFRKVSSSFRPWSQSEMRGELLREFGGRFDVSGTGNYLVVHPAGKKDLWAQRFEKIYRAFVHYFSVRGARPTPPEFPLVAVVFHSQQEFLQYSRQIGKAVPSGVLGFYGPQTNRILLYDITQGRESDENWHINAETIIHEATHQIAFNTGVHNRIAQPPRWVGEGLATMFEAPGVWNPRHHPHRKDRINRRRLEAFRTYAPNRPSGYLAQTVSQSPREFVRTPGFSYAEAWALTFFLSETEPVKYAQYLAKTAVRQPLKNYSNSEQLGEFTDVFGGDLKMLEARYLRFIQQLD